MATSIETAPLNGAVYAATPYERMAAEMPPARLLWPTLAACVGGYLYGSLPVVFWLGKRRAVDLRWSGSGNVGATNLLAGGARGWSVAGWLFDASKGCLPIWASRRLGLNEEVAGLAGVFGVVGQCWPVFLRFRGGRGISAFVGASAMMTDGMGWTAILAPLAGGGVWRVLARMFGGGRSRQGVRSKSVPFGCFLGISLSPIICAVRRPWGRGMRLAPSLITLVLLLRRLTAPQPDDLLKGPAMRWQALVYRLLFDRNTSL